MNLLLDMGKLFQNPLSAAHVGLVVQTSPVQLKHAVRGKFDVFLYSVLKLTVAKISHVRIWPFFGNWKHVRALIVPGRVFLEWSEGSPGPQMPSTGPWCRR